MKVVKRHLRNVLGRRLGSAQRSQLNATRLGVEGVESRQLLAVFTVTNPADVAVAGQLNLRETIILANANPGPDTIAFNLPGAGVQVIQPLTPLPAITDNATTIDGYTQAGASRNTQNVGSDANILIRLDGSLLPANPNSSGLVLNSSNNEVTGLSITNFGGNVANRFGIVIAGNNIVATGNHIHGNFIGLNPNGVTEQGNTIGVGIRATFPGLAGAVGFADSNIVGFDPADPLSAAAQRNVISGANDRPGISAAVQISAGAAVAGTADNNIVRGNYLGTDASGNNSDASLSNIYGVRIQLGASNNTVGGANATDRNVIGGVPVTGGTNTVGVLIEDNNTSNNQVIGNFIGVQANGNPGGLALTSGVGINGLLNNAANIQNTIIQNNRIHQSAGDGVFIFGINAGNTDIIGNEIIGSGDDGVSIVGNSAGNQISANIISGSGANGGGGLGIDLSDDGVSPNDALDADSGENNVQNFPVIASVVNNGINARIIGSLTSTPNTTFNIEFFSNDVPNPSGFGEGLRIINTIQVTTDAGGVANFQFDLAPADVPVGSFISATATDAGTFDTSEFAASILALREILVSIDDVVITEPDDGGVAFATFTVTANSPLHGGFQVNFDTPPFAGAVPDGFGFATNSVDFNGQGNVLFFGPGQTRGTIAIPINGDSVAELDELFQVTLRDPQSFSGLEVITIVENPAVAPPVVPLTQVVGQALILDNDASFSINDVQVAEGGNLTFTVTLNGPTSRPLSVNFAVADGSANSGADFTPLASGTLNFPIGTTTQQVVVATLNDLLVEGAENLFVNLSNPQYGTALPVLPAPFNQPPAIPVVDAKLLKGQGVGTIMDADSPLPTASISDVVVAENAGTVTFTVTLSSANNDPIVLTYGTSDGSALSGQDYTATVNTLLIPANTLVSTFTVPILNDDVPEFDENFFATIAYQSGNVLIGDAVGQATIVDNDGNNNVQIVVDAIGTPATEPSTGQSVLTFRVRLLDQNGNPAQSAKTVLVNFNTGAAGDTATANDDYTALAGTLIFAPGQTVQTISVPVLADNVFEPTETVSVQLSGAINGTIQTGTATGSILDNTTPTISISDIVVAENVGNATFTVTLDQQANVPIVLNFGTANGSAQAGLDYTATSGSVTIPVGATQATFTVPILDDAIPEFDENFFANLSLQSDNAILGDSQAQATIVDNDANSTIRVVVDAIGSPTVEPSTGQAALTFRVRLLDPNGAPAQSDKTVLVNFATGAAGDTATANLDYTAVSGTLVFAPGQNTQTIIVPVLADNLFEAAETVSVILGNAINASIQTGTATGTIVDRTTPTISISDIVVAENVGNATFTVTLDQQANVPIVLNFGTANGSAQAGLDYTATSGSVTIPVGATQATFTVPILDDLIPEFDEAFTVNLSLQNGDTAILGDSQAQATIVDNDANSTIRVVVDAFANPAVEPGAGQTNAVTFRVRLLDPNGAPAQSDKTVLVNFNTGAAGDTATANADYNAVGGTLVFAPGENIKLVNVNVIGDNVFEATENFTLTLNNAINAAIQTGTATGTILDRTLPDSFAPDIVVNENIAGGLATFTVNLAQPTNAPVTIFFSTRDGSAVANQDYTPTSGSVVVPAGATQATFTVPILNDNIQETTENFFVNVVVFTGNSTLLEDEIQATIVDDDANVRVVIEAIDTTVKEPRAGESVFANFRVRLVDANGNPIQSDRTVQVNFRSGAAGDTATSDLDYQGVGGTLTFAPGENIKVISVPILQDDRFEIDPERFTVQLINAVNGTIAVGSAVGTILDNSGPAQVTDIQRLGFHNGITAIVVKLNVPLDPASAQNVNNYSLARPGRDKRFGTADDAPVRIVAAVLSPDGTTLTLFPSRKLPLAQRVRLVINGLEPNGVRDRNGNLIDGDRDGVFGGNFVANLGPGTYRDLRRGNSIGEDPLANRPFGQNPVIANNVNANNLAAGQIKAVKPLKVKKA